MGKVTAINPAGREVEVDESSLAYLGKLGYRTKTTEEHQTEAFEEGKDEYYSGFGQTALTFGEGVASGLTLGLADLAMDDEATRERAERHPIARGAGEVAGIVAPAILSGGTSLAGTVARATPAGALARGAEKLGVKAASGRLGQLAVAGTVEGVGDATGGLVASALAGDEVTPEAITHQLGMGALFGFGAGVAGRGLEKAATKLFGMAKAADDVTDTALKAEAGEVGEEIAGRVKAPWVDSPEAYQYTKRVNGAVQSARDQAEKRFKVAVDNYSEWGKVYEDVDNGLPDELAEFRGPARGGDTGGFNPNKRSGARAQAASQPQGAYAPVDPSARGARGTIDPSLQGADDAVAASDSVAAELVDDLDVPSHLRGTRPVRDSQIMDVRENAAQWDEHGYLAGDMQLVDDVPTDAIRQVTDSQIVGSQTIGRKASQRAPQLDAGSPQVGSQTAKFRRGVDDAGGDADRALVGSDMASAPRALNPGDTVRINRGSNKATQRIGDEYGPHQSYDVPRPPTSEEVFDAAISAGQKTDDLDEAAKTLFSGRTPEDNFWGKENFKRGKEVMGLIQARGAMKDLPDLSLESLQKMSVDEVAEVAQRLDVLHKHAPDLAKALTNEMSAAFGSAAPKLKGWEALDVVGYHKVSNSAIEKLAASNDAGKNVVALWATLKGLEQKAGKRAVAGVMKEGAEAGASKLGKTAGEVEKEAGKEAADEAKGPLGFAGRMVRRAAGRAAGSVIGGATMGPVGYVLGWAVTDGLMSGSVAAGVKSAKRKALLSTAKALGALKGPGRPMALVHMATHDKLKTPAAPAEDVDGMEEQALARHRIEQAIYAASSSGRERLADILSPLRAKSPELASAMEADARRRAEYLARYAPKKPHWSGMIGKEWVYPQEQVDRFAAVHRAVQQPLTVLEDFAAGTLTPDAAAAFRETSPGLYRLVHSYIVDHFDASEASYAESFGVSMLLGMPMHPTMHFIPTLQQNFTRPTPQATPQSASVGDPGSARHATKSQQTTER